MIDIPAIATASLSHVNAIVNHYLPGGRQSGPEYVCADLSGGKGDSTSVNTMTGKWADFATGDKGGDLVSLVAASLNCSQLDAARELAEFIGQGNTSVTPPKAVRSEIWKPTTPVPADAPPAPKEHYKHGVPVAVETYRDRSGRVLYYEHRYESPSPIPGRKNDKAFAPLTYCRSESGKLAWRFQAIPDNRPLLGLEHIQDDTTAVLICEGGKAVAAARRMVGDKVVVLTWSGGSNAVDKTDFSPLRGLHVYVWPDADKPGGKAGLAVADAAVKAGALSAKIVIPPPNVVDGFDLADAEAEGWTAEQVMAHLKASVAPEEFRKVCRDESLPKTDPAPQIKKMSDLIRTVFAPIQWVIYGLLPEGLAILSGPPKIGKSWLVMGLCLAKAVGGYALGKFKVDAGEVLLLSLEDNERRLKGRLQTCMGDESPDLSKFHATTTWRRLDQGGLGDLDAWLGDHPGCRLVVIDTIGKIKAHPKRRGGNAYENDYDSYGELQRLALERHCCILVIHHNRKSDSKNDGDPLEQISGSTGTTGAMDTIMMLRRPRGSSGAVLTATGRDIAEAEYGMSFDGTLGQWVVTGAAEEVSLGDSTKAIVDVMREHAGQALRAQEVYDKLGGDIPLPTLRTKLYRLAEKGILTKYNGAFVYTKGVNSVNGVNGSNSDTAVNNGGEVVSINSINTLTPETVLHEIPDFDV